MGNINIKNNIEKILDDNKAQNIISIDLKNKSYIADYMVIASGTSSRHLQALSEILVAQLKRLGVDNCRIEGKESNDWKLVDTQDVIVHIFSSKKKKVLRFGKYVVRRNSKGEGYYMRKFLFLPFILLVLLSSIAYSKNELYEKIDLFGEVLENIKKEYVDDVNQSEIMDSAINGVLQSLDPYSAYMSPELFREMQTDTKGEFGGLGIEIGMESGVVKVISPIDDTPAAKAGIKAGDYIVKIGKDQVQGKSLLEAVKLMRGPVGTSIELTIRRKNIKKPLKFVIVRKIIEVQSVSSKLIGDEKNLGYIRLKSFNENSDKQFLKSVKKFEKISKIKGYVLDLRNNPGGLLTQAINITDFFFRRWRDSFY